MSYYWHEEPDGGAHESLFAVAKTVEEDQAWRWVNHRAYASLYKDRHVTGFSPGKWRFSPGLGMTPQPGFPAISTPLTYNVVRSCIDTSVSQICLSRPMPKVLTSAASTAKQRAARQLERFIWGVLMWNNAWESGSDIYRDGCLYGDGYPYVRAEGRRILIEKIHPSNILVDDNAAMNGRASTLMHRDWYSRDDLTALWPERKDDILRAERDLEANTGQLQRDLVKVVQGWRLGTGGTPGRHVVAVSTATLQDAAWGPPRFPIAPVRWSRDLAGWHGTGLAEELQAIQLEINSVLGKISDNLSLFANPYIANPRSSGIIKEHWQTNLPGRILDYDGPNPPSIITPPGINEQVFAYLEKLYQRAFEITGISMLAATSQKPSGLYSNAALLSYIDVQTKRFSQQSRRWEQLFVDLAWRIIDVAKHAEDIDGVHYLDPDSGELGRVDFAELDFDDDMIEVQIYPASSLPKEMSGRIQDIVNLVQGGVVDRPQAASLLSDPDVDKFVRLNNAPLEDLQSIMEAMLATGRYIPPLQYQDCALGIKVATRYWAKARIANVSDEKTGLLEVWMDEAAKLLGAGQGKPPAPLPPPPQSTAPGAMPAMPEGPGSSGPPA